MNGSEIKEFLSNFPNVFSYFKGIYYIDRLPKFLKNFSFLICNTDFSGGSGKHWIVFIKINKVIECFDSLGINSEKKKLLQNFCKFTNADEILFNETSYQAENSIACGKFVLYFILERYYNLDCSFEEVLSDSFDFNAEINETKVSEFYSEHKNK